jgi:hypothetical protein
MPAWPTCDALQGQLILRGAYASNAIIVWNGRQIASPRKDEQMYGGVCVY